MSDKHIQPTHTNSQETSAADRLRADQHAGEGHGDQKKGQFSLRPMLEKIDDAIEDFQKNNPFHQPEKGLVGGGCYAVDMHHDKPTKTNELLKDKATDSYNCKYYVKTFMDGKAPAGDNGRHEELNSTDLTSRGYTKVEGKGFMKPGDIVLVLPNADVRTFSPVVHAAVVTEAGPGGQGVMLTQKPDGKNPVTRTDLNALCREYGVTANQCHIEIYRNAKKPVKP